MLLLTNAVNARPVHRRSRHAAVMRARNLVARAMLGSLRKHCQVRWKVVCARVVERVVAVEVEVEVEGSSMRGRREMRQRRKMGSARRESKSAVRRWRVMVRVVRSLSIVCL